MSSEELRTKPRDGIPVVMHWYGSKLHGVLEGAHGPAGKPLVVRAAGHPALAAVGALPMSLSTVIVAINAQLLRRADLAAS